MAGRRLVLCTVLLSWLAPLQLSGQTPKLLPRDDSDKSPSFLAFKHRLLAAIEARDAEFLTSILSPDLKCSFGDCYGVADFFEEWHPADPRSEIWDELERILDLGVVLQGDPETGYFSAPYVFRAFPDEYDPFAYGAVVRQDAPVRAGPGQGSEIRFRLSYDIVKLFEWLPDPERPGCRTCGWHRIETLDGRDGFMNRADARSPVDYRVVFERVDGRWLVRSFLAGD